MFVLQLMLLCVALPVLALLAAGLAGLVAVAACDTRCASLPVFIAQLLPADSSGFASVAKVLLGAAGETALLAAGVLTIAVTLGVATAWLTSQYRFTGRRVFQVLLLTPLALPAYVAAYAWVELLAYDAPLATALRNTLGIERLPDVRTTLGATFVLGMGLFPYVYAVARVAFAQHAARLGEVAASLGVSGWAAFWRLHWPLSRPAVAAGASLVLMETLADYGVSAYMGVNTVTVTLYQTWFAGEQKLIAIGLVLCLLAACAVLLKLERRFRNKGGVSITAATRRELPQLSRLNNVLAALFCITVVALGFAVPLGSLLSLWLTDSSASWAAQWQRVWPAVTHSVQFAALGASAVLALTTAALIVKRWYASKPSAVIKLLNKLIAFNQLGYAVPGVAIALAILWPVAAFDRVLAGWLGTGLLLTGTGAAVVFAYVIRFYAVGHNGVQSGLERISPQVQDAAQSLGAGAWQTARRVYAPLLAPSFATAWVLVWIDCLKELPATLMLRPFNSDTLPVLIFQWIADERAAQAALPSLILTLVGLIPIVLAAIRQKNQTHQNNTK